MIPENGEQDLGIFLITSKLIFIPGQSTIHEDN
jgi:hypothetical protein